MENLEGIERILIYTLLQKRGLFLIGQRAHHERKKLTFDEKRRGMEAEEEKKTLDTYEFPHLQIELKELPSKMDYPAILAKDMKPLLGIRVKPVKLLGETVNKELLVKWLLCNQTNESEHPRPRRRFSRYVYVPGEELYDTYKFRKKSGSVGFMIEPVAKECNITTFLDGKLPYLSRPRHQGQ